MGGWAHGLAVMITPLHGVGHRFESGWAHSNTSHRLEMHCSLPSNQADMLLHWFGGAISRELRLSDATAPTRRT